MDLHPCFVKEKLSGFCLKACGFDYMVYIRNRGSVESLLPDASNSPEPPALEKMKDTIGPLDGVTLREAVEAWHQPPA